MAVPVSGAPSIPPAGSLLSMRNWLRRELGQLDGVLDPPPERHLTTPCPCRLRPSVFPAACGGPIERSVKYCSQDRSGSGKDGVRPARPAVQHEQHRVVAVLAADLDPLVDSADPDECSSAIPFGVSIASSGPPVAGATCGRPTRRVPGSRSPPRRPPGRGRSCRSPLTRNPRDTAGRASACSANWLLSSAVTGRRCSCRSPIASRRLGRLADNDGAGRRIQGSVGLIRRHAVVRKRAFSHRRSVGGLP